MPDPGERGVAPKKMSAIEKKGMKMMRVTLDTYNLIARTAREERRGLMDQTEVLVQRGARVSGREVERIGVDELSHRLEFRMVDFSPEELARWLVVEGYVNLHDGRVVRFDADI